MILSISDMEDNRPQIEMPALAPAECNIDQDTLFRLQAEMNAANNAPLPDLEEDLLGFGGPPPGSLMGGPSAAPSNALFGSGGHRNHNSNSNSGGLFGSSHNANSNNSRGGGLFGSGAHGPSGGGGLFSSGPPRPP
mmetsp:Transcript_11941/g.18433  ORF Transcript_11941/g.18433 Transcript_11941/m.18433 type:complete len:136 (-) Transcript_11941:2488-2895(-)